MPLLGVIRQAPHVPHASRPTHLVRAPGLAPSHRVRPLLHISFPPSLPSQVLDSLGDPEASALLDRCVRHRGAALLLHLVDSLVDTAKLPCDSAAAFAAQVRPITPSCVCRPLTHPRPPPTQPTRVRHRATGAGGPLERAAAGRRRGAPTTRPRPCRRPLFRGRARVGRPPPAAVRRPGAAPRPGGAGTGAGGDRGAPGRRRAADRRGGGRCRSVPLYHMGIRL